MKLSDWLKSNGIRYSAFARQLGVNHVTVRRYIRGERTPRPDIVAAIHRETGGEVTAADWYELPDEAA